jgi:hypothetical protein
MAVRKAPQQRVSKAEAVGAPTKGINDLDPLAAMDPTYCIELNNWFPSTGSLISRGGYQEWATDIPSPVVTLIPMNMADGTRKLFAATDTGIYDVSAKGASPPLSYAISDGYVKYVQFSTVATNYLVVANEPDTPLFSDGTTWAPFVAAGVPTLPGEISGIAPSLLTSVSSFKNRLWFVQGGTMTAWYLPSGAMAGVAKPFYLGGFFKRGGALLEIIDWSANTNDGLHNSIAFRSTTGEVLIYQGDDPDAIVGDLLSPLILQGLFFTSAPIGGKSSVRFGADTVLLTRMGLVPLGALVSGNATDALYEGLLSSRNISRTITRIVRSSGYNPNWELQNYPTLNAIIILIPASGGYPAAQFVMNSLTGAWCKFDLPAQCMAYTGTSLYFGGYNGNDKTKGAVYVYGEVQLDNVKLNGDGGQSIVCSFFTAYNYYGDQTTNKHFKMFRPIFQSDQPQSFASKLNVDYELEGLYTDAPPIYNASGTADLWDASKWDTAVWTQVRTTYKPWATVTGIGFCAALLMKMNTRAEVAFVAYEMVYEPGGVV